MWFPIELVFLSLFGSSSFGIEAALIADMALCVPWRSSDDTAQDLMIQQDEAIARQLQEELYLEDDLQALGRQRNAGGSSARSSVLFPSSAQNWSMYGWGESAMSNIQSTVGQLGQGWEKRTIQSIE